MAHRRDRVRPALEPRRLELVRRPGDTLKVALIHESIVWQTVLSRFGDETGPWDGAGLGSVSIAGIALTPPPHATFRRRRTGFCGIASILLLGASIKWVHHWSPRSDLIVAAWAVATAVAFVGGIRLNLAWETGNMGRFAKLGLFFASMSIAALIISGIAYAAGSDPAGACGGG